MVKQSTTYDLWVRPTISWKLECEGSFSRSEILTAISKDDNKVELNTSKVRFQACFAFSTAILFWGISWSAYPENSTEKTINKGFKCFLVGQLLVEACFFLSALIIVIKQ